MTDRDAPDSPHRSRREFLSRAAMVGGLVGGYGAFGLIAGRYLYPARPDERTWQLVTDLEKVAEGETILYRAPDGETINVTRRGTQGTDEDFIALSSTCPHLGCQVHWESQNSRFFCPCHNGVFTPEGVAIEGPPAEAGQSLSQHPIRVEEGLLYILVATRGLVADAGGQVLERGLEPEGPGHDPCLSCLNREPPTETG